MNRIEFKDLPSTDTPLNAETFNTLQDNIENAINEKQDAGDYVLKNEFNNIKGTILWKNSNTSSNFNSQTINLNLANYDVVEIYFSEGSSFKTEVGKIGNVYIIQDANGNFTGAPFVYLRRIQTRSSNIQFGDCLGQQTGQSGAWNTNNSRLKPLYIVGYNIGLNTGE